MQKRISATQNMDSYFVITKYVWPCTSRGVFRTKTKQGQSFCDHTITSEAISVAEPNKNNSLQAKTALRITINIIAA